MRHLLTAAIVLFVFSCSGNNTTKNANSNSNVEDGGWDVSTLDARNNATNNNQVDSGPLPDNGGLPDSGNADAGASDVGSTDAGVAPDMAVPPSPCPAPDPPAAGSMCTQAGLQCEYGDDPRESCRTRAVCADGSWGITSPRCVPLPDVMCPATREAASGELCDVMDAYCDYDGLVCHCTNCIDGPVIRCEGDPTWMCKVPNPDAACPAAKPRLGDGCRDDGQACVYHCGPEGGRTCRGGAWRASDGGSCPISTVQVKRDIHYLSPGELAEISAAVQSIPLARYHYTDPSIGRGEKLGFIIEDMPPTTPAVDQQRLMVDLYGYTSMLVADAQAREKRMRVLEDRLADLEAKTLQCGE